jgi:hypothetical protein
MKNKDFDLTKQSFPKFQERIKTNYRLFYLVLIIILSAVIYLLWSLL